MHPVLAAIKAEFDKAEEHMVRTMTSGNGVPDWPAYKALLGRITECREGRSRALDAAQKQLGSEDA